MSGHANHHRPRISFDPMDLTRLTLTEGLDRKLDRARWREAVERELAHQERRDAETLHDLKMPKRDR